MVSGRYLSRHLRALTTSFPWASSLAFLAIYTIVALVTLERGLYFGVAPVWPGLGIAVVFLLRTSWRWWPIVAIAQIITSLAVQKDALATIGTGLSEGLGSLSCAFFLTRLRSTTQLESISSVFALFLAAAAGSCVSTAFGVFAISEGAFDPLDIATWTYAATWWCGHVLGILFVAPFADTHFRNAASLSASRLIEFTIGAAAIAVSTYAAIALWYPSGFLIIPTLVWLSLRFGHFGAQIALLLSGAAAVLASRHQPGALASFTPTRDGLAPVWFQLVFLTAALVSLLISVLVRSEAKRLAVEQTNEAKNRFIANVSHELRDPLGVIHGFADSAVSHRLTPTEITSALEIILRSARGALRLVDDILDIAKLEAGRLSVSPSPFHVAKLAAEVVEPYRARAQTAGLSFSTSIDTCGFEWAVADSMRVRQILVNLLNNAFKFTQTGKIELSLVCEHQMVNGEVLMILKFAVTDTGIGLSPAQARTLFRPFSQAHDNLSFGGSGLGLALSLDLAKALGGELRLAASEPGKGSRFELDIPAQKLERAETETAEASTAQTQPLAGLRVLLVDDLVENQFLFTKILSSAGAQVETASNGRDGSKRALSGLFDAVLMDLRMPEMDGYQAAAFLRQSGYSGALAALTGSATQVERTRSLASGFDEHLIKPIEPEVLVQKLRSLAALGKSRWTLKNIPPIHIP